MREASTYGGIHLRGRKSGYACSVLLFYFYSFSWDSTPFSLMHTNYIAFLHSVSSSFVTQTWIATLIQGGDLFAASDFLRVRDCLGGWKLKETKKGAGYLGVYSSVSLMPHE